MPTGTSTRRLSAHRAVPALCVAAALTLSGCGEDEPAATAPVESVEETTTATAEETQATDTADPLADGPVVALEDLSSNTQEYVDDPVLTSGAVAEVLEPTSFTLRGEEGPTNEPLLVVGEMATSPAMGDVIEVVGVVRDGFDVATVEGDLGVDLDDALYADHAGDPYIEASQVRPADGA